MAEHLTSNPNAPVSSNQMVQPWPLPTCEKHGRFPCDECDPEPDPTDFQDVESFEMAVDEWERRHGYRGACDD